MTKFKTKTLKEYGRINYYLSPNGEIISIAKRPYHRKSRKLA